MKKMFLFTLLAPVLLAACHKDKPEAAVNTTPTLLGKWTLDSTTVEQHYNGVVNYVSNEPAVGSTINKYDFRADGNVQIVTFAWTYLYPYTINNADVTFNGLTYQIRNLGTTRVSLYYRTDYSASLYDERYMKLKR
jgi:hypothetical protein